jgi:hypothetical protein
MLAGLWTPAISLRRNAVLLGAVGNVSIRIPDGVEFTACAPGAGSRDGAIT